MKKLSLREMNGEWSLRILIALVVLVALILVGMPAKAAPADAGPAAAAVGQVNGAAETTRLAALANHPPLETPLVSWNS